MEGMKTEGDHIERTFSAAIFSHTKSVFKQPSYRYVLPAIFMYFLVIFGIFPLTTQIHISQVCADLDEDDCDSSRVSAHASTINLFASLALSISSILTCGIYGSIADVYGRKIVIIAPFMGLMIYAAAYLYVDTWNPSSYVAIIVSANVIMGLSGSYIVFIMGSLCYASDATILMPHTRRDVYSYAEATIMTPEVFGPVLTGIWASYYGFFVPLVMGVVLSGLAICYIALLPESLPPDAHSRTLPLQLSPFQTFTNVAFLFAHAVDPNVEPETGLHSLAVAGAARSTSKQNDAEPRVAPAPAPKEASPLPWIGLAFMLYFMAVMGQAAVRIVYVTHRFSWDAGVIGIYDGMEGFVVAMSMVCAPSVTQYVLRLAKPMRLVTWLQIGFLFRVIHWCLFGLMQETAGIFFLLPLLFFVGPMAPYTRTIMSNTVTASEQARIFSAFSALEGISSLLAPLYSAGYTLFVQAGAPWLIFEVMAAATLVGLGIVTYVRVTPSLSKHMPEDRHIYDEYVEGQVCDAPAGAVDADQQASPLLGEPGAAGHTASAAHEGVVRAAEQRRLRVSVSSAHSRVSSVVEDSSTLQFYHLSRPSADATQAGVTGSVDRGHEPGSLTARLLAEPREELF